MKLAKIDIDQKSVFDVSGINEFGYIKLAGNWLKKSGYEVLDGSDFESNMLLHFYAGRRSGQRTTDRYIRTKLGKSSPGEASERYARKAVEILGDDAKRLMKVCRVCSFMGGPGFPDFLASKDDAKLVYVGYDYTPNQKMFMFLAKLLGRDVLALPYEYEDDIRIDAEFLLRDVLSTERIVSRHESLKLVLAGAEGDERAYTKQEIRLLPFPLFEKWLEQGEADKAELLAYLEEMESIIDERDQELNKYIDELQKDGEYRKFGRGRDDETLKKKVGYIQNKFNICDIKAKELINFAE